jgi:hypothetical protein
VRHGRKEWKEVGGKKQTGVDCFHKMDREYSYVMKRPGRAHLHAATESAAVGLWSEICAFCKKILYSKFKVDPSVGV